LSRRARRGWRDPDALRAAWWTVRAIRSARSQLRANAFDAVRLPGVPAVSPGAVRGVNAVLRRSRTSCLVNATIQQAWYAAHGAPRHLVIGVKDSAEGFEAHAWLEGDSPCHHEHFQELTRRPAVQ
jgi:hypothetical protein